jgi:hypothetical protein
MVTAVLDRPTLVLNRNWQPVGVATVAKALTKVWNESARIVDPADYQQYTWQDWAQLRLEDGDLLIQPRRFQLRVAEVVALTKYDRLPTNAVSFRRRNPPSWMPRTEPTRRFASWSRELRIPVLNWKSTLFHTVLSGRIRIGTSTRTGLPVSVSRHQMSPLNLRRPEPACSHRNLQTLNVYFTTESRSAAEIFCRMASNCCVRSGIFVA